MPELLLAIDVGTNVCKAAVLGPGGETVAKSFTPYETRFPKPGWAQIEPDSIWEACVASIKAAIQQTDPTAIQALGISAQLGLVGVMRDGCPSSKVFPWMDRRALAEAERMVEILGAERIYRVTGRRCDPEWPACKMIWLRENDPKAYDRTHKFLTIKDFLIQRLTGQFVVDHVHASYSMLFNVKDRSWEEPFFQELCLDRTKVPDSLDCTEVIGELSRDRANEFGLPRLPVVAGGPDGTLGALGAGLVHEGTAVNVAGTTDVLFACMSSPSFDPAMRTLVNCYIEKDKWSHGGPLSLTGGCLKWFCENFAERETELAVGQGLTTYQFLDREASALPPGAESLLFIPSLSGERTPSWDPKARGVVSGISPSHSKAHFYRAILEGSTFVLKSALIALQEQGIEIEQVILVGGGSKSRLWTSIRADVLGIPLVLPEAEEATLLGASLIAGIGTGLYSNSREAVDRTARPSTVVEPDPRRQAVYQEIYQRFVELQSRK